MAPQRRQSYCGEKAARISPALPGNIKCGAVIYACPDYRKSKSGIHTLVKSEHFEGNMPLVMIHRNYAVKLLPYFLYE